jgi:hypothetical protein
VILKILWQAVADRLYRRHKDPKREQAIAEAKKYVKALKAQYPDLKVKRATVFEYPPIVDIIFEAETSVMFFNLPRMSKHLPILFQRTTDIEQLPPKRSFLKPRRQRFSVWISRQDIPVQEGQLV